MTDKRTKTTSISSIQPKIDNNYLDDSRKMSPPATELQQMPPNTDKPRQNSDLSTKGGKSSPKKSNSVNGKKPKITQVDALENCTSCQERLKEENFMEHIPFYKKCHHKFCYKLFIFAVITGLNIADLISDWLLYRDVVLTEDGLVLGKIEDSLRYSLLAFSVIGSLTFTFEIVNLWWEIFRNNPWIDSDLSSAITVWIEDVPQIIINVVIVACREEAISYFQLVKASVIILGAVIRIAVSLFKYCSKGALHDLECAKQNKESCRHVTYRVFIMVGLFLTLGGAVTIFMFTQSERNEDGTLNFKVPHSIIDGEFDDQKYFRNVSMYFSHKLVDRTARPTDATHINLIKIAMINDIRKKDQDITVRVAYDNINAAKTKIVVTQTASSTLECFEFDKNANTAKPGSNCQTYIPGAKSEIIFTFHFVKSKIPGLIFGDITYNVKEKGPSGQCSDVKFSIEDNIVKRLGDASLAAMHYFRINEGQDGQHSIISDRFYTTDDLTDVTEVWQTGFAYCKSTGSVAPHFDGSIRVPC